MLGKVVRHGFGSVGALGTGGRVAMCATDGTVYDWGSDAGLQRTGSVGRGATAIASHPRHGLALLDADHLLSVLRGGVVAWTASVEHARTPPISVGWSGEDVAVWDHDGHIVVLSEVHGEVARATLPATSTISVHADGSGEVRWVTERGLRRRHFEDLRAHLLRPFTTSAARHPLIARGPFTLELCARAVVLWGAGDPISSPTHGSRIVAADGRSIGRELVYAFLDELGILGVGVWRGSGRQQPALVRVFDPPSRGSVVPSPHGFVCSSNRANMSIHSRLITRSPLQQA